MLGLVVLALWLTSGWWTASIGRSLACAPDRAPTDAILIDNFDTQYLVFERASDLRRSGRAPRVLVPVPVDPGTSQPKAMSVGFAEVMATIARLGRYELVPTREVEPISLNVARDVLRFLQQQDIRSVTVVSPLFRSRRSSLVYRSTLGPSGIGVSCEPAGAAYGITTWTRTWHGIQNVVEQWMKLQYYRLYVLPFLAH